MSIVKLDHKKIVSLNHVFRYTHAWVNHIPIKDRYPGYLCEIDSGLMSQDATDN